MNRPRALLLDEPLGALDLRLRKQLQIELKRIQQDVGITFVHVTHDQEEAMTMADTIAVMNNGRIEQGGSATDLYERPRTEFVANFLGISNLIDGKVGSREGGDGRGPDARRRQPARARRPLGPHGAASIRVGVRPEKITLAGRRRQSADGELKSCGAGRGRQLPRRLDPVPDQDARRRGAHRDRAEPRRRGARRWARPRGDLSWHPHHTFVVAKERASERTTHGRASSRRASKASACPGGASSAGRRLRAGADGLAAVLAACGGVKGAARRLRDGPPGGHAPEDRHRRLDLLQLAALHRQEGPQGVRQEHGGKVKYIEEINDNVEFFGKVRQQLQAGTPIGRDIVTLTDYMAARWVRLGYVEPIDKKNVPNFKNLVANLKTINYDPNRKYTLPWQSGMTGIGYNPKKTGRELKSSRTSSTRSSRAA